ncbi:MAG: OmpA-like transrane domain [Gammaproteobacteria bacterium]|jgi:hypothetical protein|nr:OmpA-like transrane domain [Gammaproteobacteria bacterium]
MFRKYTAIILTFFFMTPALGVSEDVMDTIPPLPYYDKLVTTPFNTPPKDEPLISYGNEYLGIASQHSYIPTPVFDNTGNNVNNHTIDLLGIISAPISEALSLHAKAGLTYLDNTNLNEFDLNNLHIGPAYGAEINYKLRRNLTLRLSWMHYNNESTFLNNSPQPGSNSMLLELSYQLFRAKR